MGSLWQYYRDELATNNNGIIIDFPDDPGNALFKSKQKVTDQTGNDGTEDVQTMVPLKYLIYFCRTLEMPLIKWEVNLFFNLACRMYYSNWNR